MFTIFSTSKDHNQGKEAMAGCILVDFENLQVINRSHAYRNVYVHRRDSVSVAKLTRGEIEERVRLGLVTETEHGGDDHDDDEYQDTEEWEDMQTDEHIDDDNDDDNNQDSDDETFTFSKRRSSVNPINTIASPQGIHDNTRWSSVDFSNVETNRIKRDCQRLSVMTTTIAEDKEEVDENCARNGGMDFENGKRYRL